MFWHLLLVLFSPLASLLSGLLSDDRDRQILALRQQLLILQRQVGKRPRLSRAEKLALLLACARRKQTQLLACHMIVMPRVLPRDRFPRLRTQLDSDQRYPCPPHHHSNGLKTPLDEARVPAEACEISLSVGACGAG